MPTWEDQLSWNITSERALAAMRERLVRGPRRRTVAELIVQAIEAQRSVGELPSEEPHSASTVRCRRFEDRISEPVDDRQAIEELWNLLQQQDRAKQATGEAAQTGRFGVPDRLAVDRRRAGPG